MFLDLAPTSPSLYWSMVTTQLPAHCGTSTLICCFGARSPPAPFWLAASSARQQGDKALELNLTFTAGKPLIPLQIRLTCE